MLLFQAFICLLFDNMNCKQNKHQSQHLNYGLNDCKTYHISNDLALVNMADIFGCFWTNLVNVGQQSHLVDT